MLLSDFSIWKKIAGVTEQSDFEWTLSKLPSSRPWCPSSANGQPAGSARGLVRVAGTESLQTSGSGPRQHGALVATLVLTKSPHSRNRGSALFREVIAGSAGIVPYGKRLPRGQALDPADVESPPGLDPADVGSPPGLDTADVGSPPGLGPTQTT